MPTKKGTPTFIKTRGLMEIVLILDFCLRLNIPL